MSPDRVRELFSEAFEGELDAERKTDFDQAIASDDELKKEYEEFVETFQLVGRLGDDESVQAPDLLFGVQERLRKRSRGRYYRDRFSQRTGPGWMMPLLLAIVCLALLAASYYVLHSTVVLEDSTTAQSPPR